MKTQVLGILVLALSLTACNAGDSPNVELIQDMMDQPAVKSQEYDETFADHAGGARVPPSGTQPVGFIPYKYATDFEGAKGNKNPLAGETSSEVLLTGQKYYETNCAVCHGYDLKPKGHVYDMMPTKPPALDTDKVKGWSDGQIYHVITMGQGVMGAYASHIPQKSRWQVVNYIRHLQKK